MFLYVDKTGIASVIIHFCLTYLLSGFSRAFFCDLCVSLIVLMSTLRKMAMSGRDGCLELHQSMVSNLQPRLIKECLFGGSDILYIMCMVSKHLFWLYVTTYPLMSCQAWVADGIIPIALIDS